MEFACDNYEASEKIRRAAGNKAHPLLSSGPIWLVSH